MKKVFWAAAFLATAALAACHGGSLPPSGAPQAARLGPHPMATATGSYAQVVLGDKPIQYFQLNESAGSTAYDGSTTQINGQYVGSVTYGVAGPLLNQSSTAISLPGSGDVGVSLPKPNVTSTSSYTVETWVYPILSSTVTSATLYMTIWGYNGTHRLLVSNTGVLLSQLNGNFFSQKTLTSGAWHDVVFVYNASTSTASYYIDGAFDSSASVSNSAAAFASTYYLGQYDTGVYYKWHGRLAQHAFFPSALSASAIASLYTSAGYGGTATPTPSPTSSPSPSATGYYDWTTYAGNVQRTGYNPTETTLTASNASQLHKLWAVNLGAVIDAQPVIAANVTVGTSKKNLLFIGAENGIFKAIDAASGAVVWSKQLGSYSNPNCTDLPVYGITGTAALNKPASVVYVADGADKVHALDLATGAEKTGWPVTVATVSQEHVYSALTYNPANGLLYAETAAYCDITPYQGRIVAINTSTASVSATFKPASGTNNGGGIWGEGGASIDASTNDVFVATGNVYGSGYSESMVRLTSLLAMKASNF